MDELLGEFLTETEESLAVVDLELVQLEQNPNNPDILSNIFRLVHTIKGTCGFLGLPRLEKVAHAAEDLLGLFRDGLEVTPKIVTLILNAIDRIREILQELATKEVEPEGSDEELIKQLREVYNNALQETSDPSAAAPEESMEDLLMDFAPQGETPPAVEPQEQIATPEEAPAPKEVKPTQAPAVQNEQAQAPTKAAPKKDVSSQSIRVTVDLLENLMNMVSELVLTRNQLLQMVRNEHDSEFAVPLQRLSHVTTELQEGVMKTRMQPIGNAWAKLPRIVRDLSIELNKKIDLEMIGADTELDRQVLELIKDPLTHMVRNSADHGSEQTAERIKKGKPANGRIVLNAYQEGGHIIIEIKDDGKGIDAEVIKSKAIEKKLLTTAEAELLNDQQILQMIFKAGFSTAEKITNVSGRGVGMDVVRTNIEKIGGTIELKSIKDVGTTFTIKIPLTLAIVSALIVECGKERFAIPQVSVIELVRASNNSEQRIECINDTSVLRLRNRLLPLISLMEVLKLNKGTAPYGPKLAGLPTREVVDNKVATEKGLQKDVKNHTSGKNDKDKSEVDDTGLVPQLEKINSLFDKNNNEISTNNKDELFIVVTQIGTYKSGIIVDRVFDTEEIVVKPVAPILRSNSIFSGNTILGDGTVIMILDPNSMTTASGVTALSDHESTKTDTSLDRSASQPIALLVFKAGGTEPKAVPLSLIARLEEVDVSTIESSNNMHMVQYRGKLMPLIMANDKYTIKEEGRQPVLVFADHEQSMGILVEEIIDIVEDYLDIEISAATDGMLGSAVVNGKATEVIDAGYYLNLAFGDWFKTHDDSSQSAWSKQRVLLIDDSSFFRNLIAPLLEINGFAVYQTTTAKEALELRNKGEMFDAVISDIEMPGMNGFELVKEIRSGGAWKDLPILALSSHTSAKDMEQGRASGFTDYIAKFDREALIHTLTQVINTVPNGESTL